MGKRFFVLRKWAGPNKSGREPLAGRPEVSENYLQVLVFSASYISHYDSK